MSFMLTEYDALPFGLLRHAKAESPCGTVKAVPKFVHCCPDPGLKVMPLDKVHPANEQGGGSFGIELPDIIFTNRAWSVLSIADPPPPLDLPYRARGH